MTNPIETLDRLITATDDAKHEANIALHEGGAADAVLLAYLSRLQGCLKEATNALPAKWRM